MTGEGNRTWGDDMARAYQDWLVPTTFQPFAVDLARRIVELRPRRVLELAAGTGVLTAELVAAGLDVVATDLNPAMVAVGAAAVPQASWRQADAMDLPVSDGEFDVVACQFGVMFLPDKVAGFAEARRVLADGGAFLFSSWDRIDTHGWERVFVSVLHSLFPDDPPTFLESVPHGYADASAICADARAAGFGDVSAETIRVEGVASSVADLARGYCTGTPARPQIEARGDLDAVTEKVVAAMVAEFGPGPAAAEMAAHVVTARR